MKGYYAQYTHFEREMHVDGYEVVYPIRIKREWHSPHPGAPEVYGITECESITWFQLACKARELQGWDSNRIKAVTREELKAQGLLWTD